MFVCFSHEECYRPGMTLEQQASPDYEKPSTEHNRLRRRSSTNKRNRPRRRSSARTAANATASAASAISAEVFPPAIRAATATAIRPTPAREAPEPPQPLLDWRGKTCRRETPSPATMDGQTLKPSNRVPRYIIERQHPGSNSQKPYTTGINYLEYNEWRDIG